MACLDELNQSADKQTWIGISRTSGDMKKFESISQFQDYQQALGCAPVRPSPYVESNAGKNTTPTGFLEFKPRDPDAQSRFDATSPQWEGVKASDEAVKSGMFIPDSAEPAASRERKPQGSVLPQPPPPAPTNDVCSIQ
uniref:Uncharacterized protein n=1 Tax=viral metagenome TaxID=1070528 RepID=A0A6C0AJA5_9ZZZZ